MGCLIRIGVASAAIAFTCSPTGKDHRASLGPGECLFDILSSATVTSFPATNLPEDVASTVQKPFRLRTQSLPPYEWRWVEDGLLPVEIRKAFGEVRGHQYWTLRPAIYHSVSDGPVKIFVRGKEQPHWDADSELFPGQYVLWSRARGNLFAISDGPPSDVIMEVTSDPVGGRGAYEIPSFPRLDSHGASPPRPADLLGRVDMGKFSRRCLCLPAPGALAIPIGFLGCDQLRVAVGVIDHCYELVDDHLELGNRGSDGVTFSVSLSSEGSVRTLWKRTVTAQDVGVWQPEVSIDLSEFLGRGCTIHLVTEPGANGDSNYDYAVWGSLRLHGTPFGKPPSPHIILLDVDTLRRDRLGCYGYHKETTPRLDRWVAEEAVIYENCTSTSPWTLPSTASIFTGLSVHQHEVTCYPRALTEGMAPLPLVLQRSGYETYGIAEGAFVAARFGFDIGFDAYDYTRFKNPDWSDALGWLRSRRSQQPFFLFLHTYLVHAPYPYDNRFEDPINPYRSDLVGKTIDGPNVIERYNAGVIQLDSEDQRYINDMYDALVRRMDDSVCDFLDSISTILQDEQYAVIFTSDHGEEFFEHGFMVHGESLYRASLEVPLVIRFPGSANGPTRDVIPNPVSTLDIVPTLLDLAGLPKPRRLPGHSLLYAHPERPARVATHSAINAASKNVHSIRLHDYKLIHGRIRSSKGASPPEQLFCLGNDPMERTNLASSEPETVRKLAEILRRYLAQYPPLQAPPTLRRTRMADLNKLRALGYVK